MEYLIKTRSLGMNEDQFFEFCRENNILKLERNARGDILVIEPIGFYTRQRIINIQMKLSLWNEQHQLGVIFDSNTGFTLPNRAVRSPDGAFITHERWRALDNDDRHKFAHICPDFIFELRSNRSKRKTSEEKMKEWMQNGCKLAWLIDPKRKKTMVFRQNGKTEVVPFTFPLSGENVLPGFTLALNDF